MNKYRALSLHGFSTKKKSLHSFYIYDWLIVSLFEQNKTQNSGQLDCVPGFPLIFMRWVFPRKTLKRECLCKFSVFIIYLFTYLFLVYFGVDDNKQIILLIFICVYIYIFACHEMIMCDLCYINNLSFFLSLQLAGRKWEEDLTWAQNWAESLNHKFMDYV